MPKRQSSSPLTVLYIDSRLTAAEEQEVLTQLHEFGMANDMRLRYLKLWTRLPVDCSADSADQLTALFRLHLRQACMPAATASLFVAPPNAAPWLPLMLQAIELETGYSPYVVQPWSRDAAGRAERSGWPRVTHWALAASLSARC